MSTTISGSTGIDRFGNTVIAGHQINHESFHTGTYATNTALIPADNTIPQITEGTEFMALSYVPNQIGSILVIDVVFSGGCNNSLMCALFDGNTDAIAGSSQWVSSDYCNVAFKFEMISVSLSAIPFTVRAGARVAGTTWFNGSSIGATFGGVMASSITVTEIAQ